MYKVDLRTVRANDTIKFHWWGPWWTILEDPKCARDAMSKYQIKAIKDIDAKQAGLNVKTYSGIFDETDGQILVYKAGKDPAPYRRINKLYPCYTLA
jgi:hypothetical protein